MPQRRSLPAIQSWISVVLPKPGGAETNVKRRASRSPSASRATSRGRATVFGRAIGAWSLVESNGSTVIAPASLPMFSP